MQITIEYKGVEFDVDYDYQPAEAPVYYYRDGSGYPGCPEAVEQINEFKHKGTCFMEFIEDCHEEIEELILQKMAVY